MQTCESCVWFWVLSWTSLTETWCRASTCWGLAFGAGEIKIVGQPFSTRTSDPKSTPFWYGLNWVDYLSMSIKANVPNLLVNQNLAVPTKPFPIFREIGGMYWNYINIAIFHHIYHNYHIHISIHISIICVCIYIYIIYTLYIYIDIYHIFTYSIHNTWMIYYRIYCIFMNFLKIGYLKSNYIYIYSIWICHMFP